MPWDQHPKRPENIYQHGDVAQHPVRASDAHHWAHNFMKTHYYSMHKIKFQLEVVETDKQKVPVETDKFGV